MLKKLSGILCFIALFKFGFSQQIEITKQFKSQQLIVVKTKNWNAIQGTLSTYEWTDDKWKIVESNIPIVVGRSGLAWGKSLLKDYPTDGKQKKEGDGNSPAGIFSLNGLFGYENISSKMNSIKVDLNTFCVDDISSGNYNRIVKTDTTVKNWNSAETMKLEGDGYKYGIFIDYNTTDIEPGKGSCIFIHIWKNNQTPTSGCTAMAEQNILKLIRFLDKNKKPLLVQVPVDEYKKLKNTYVLP